MSPAVEKHFTIRELAELWGVSVETVRRIFEDNPGVLKISHPVKLVRRRKPRVTLRIPISVAERAHAVLCSTPRSFRRAS